MFAANGAAGLCPATGRTTHAKRYAERMTAYLGLGMRSHVIEVASHDGYLLEHFSKLGIPVIGIEPDHTSAVRAMKARGIPTLTGSFGRDMARRLAAEGIDADLMVASNPLSGVPDIDDFLGGFAPLLNAEGVATFEIDPTSCLYPRAAHHFAANDLRIFDVEPLMTLRGLLQVFACRTDSAWQRGPLVDPVLATEPHFH